MQCTAGSQRKPAGDSGLNHTRGAGWVLVPLAKMRHVGCGENGEALRDKLNLSLKLNLRRVFRHQSENLIDQLEYANELRSGIPCREMTLEICTLITRSSYVSILNINPVLNDIYKLAVFHCKSKSRT